MIQLLDRRLFGGLAEAPVRQDALLTKERIQMKYHFFIILLTTLLFFGCATTYKPISRIDSIGDATVNNDDIEVTVGIQPGESKNGMVFFDKRGGGRYNIAIAYSDSSSQKKELLLPYKI